MSDLLPHNATPAERAMDDATARLGAVDVPVRTVWDPATCPADLLPWLGWALSVDQWDPAWSDAQKRATIAAAIEVQQIKGTIGAVRQSLSALGLGVRVLEWHRQQSAGAPYTYKLLVDVGADAPAATQAQIAQALAVVERTKSLRSHLEAVEISVTAEAGPFVAAVSSVGQEIVVGYDGQLV